MITTVDEFLAAAYRRDQIERRPLTDAEIADMTRLLAKRDLAAKMADLKGIPEQRCHLSASYRGFLTRALAQA